jgi:uncharacterized membrane protein
MNPVSTYLAGHWLAGLCLLLAGLLFAVLLWKRRRSGQWSLPALLGAAALLLLGLGGMEVVSLLANGFGYVDEDGTIPFALGIVAFSCAGVFVALLAVVIVSGAWSAALGYALAAVLVFSLGGALLPVATQGLHAAGLFLASLEPLEPWWLLLLLLIPAMLWWSYRPLVSLGATRRLLALGLRGMLVVLLALALSETHARQPDRNLTVMFLWDRSLSIPPEPVGDRDAREDRLFSFINEAVEYRGAGHEEDRAGVIVFGRRPRLELPPGAVPKLGFKKVLSQIDNTYTDIGGAIKLALATFPEGTAKRIVLISDGNENLGQAEEQAKIARQNGVQIDVVPIAAGRHSANEVLVERVEAPPYTDKDARVPLRIILRSFHPQVVVGTLTLTKIGLAKRVTDEGHEEAFFDKHDVMTTKVKLKQGLNVFYHQQPGTKKEESYTYEAKFVPDHVETAAGLVVQQGLPGDRIENNRASVSVIARGQPALLFVESKAGDHKLFIDRLRAARPHLKIHGITPKGLGQVEDVPLFLSQYDCVVLANVAADEVDEKVQKALRSNTYDQGCGLIMIGGPQSFGAGGWQNTEVEKALPVTMDIKSMKVEAKSGLVLMMHASEMAEGNAWQRKIAKLAIERLSPVDMVGMLYYDHGPRGGGHQWHIPFQQIGGHRNNILALVNTMEPGDMPDCDPAFVKAYNELTKAEYELGIKHIIFISDGDHWNAHPANLKKLHDAKITCTTVCITTHGQDEVKKMAAVAKAISGPTGRSYHIKDPAELPAIYIKETRLISQSFVHEKRFGPKLLANIGPTEGLSAPLPDLFGFVRTTKRASPLVEMPIETPKIGESTFPILAYWQYGLGKSVAFTSDARTLREGDKAFWDRDWASSNVYTKFWEQTVDYAMRAVDTGQYLKLNTEVRDGKIRLILNARDEKSKAPITGLLDQDEKKGFGLRVGITFPSIKGGEQAKSRELKFEQTAGGVYEAELPAEEVGSYFINIDARWQKDGQDFGQSVRAGVTIPYSPEFAEMESNVSLLEHLRQMSGGQSYTETAEALRRTARSGEIFRTVPLSHSSLQTLWPWFVFLAGLCLLGDVAVRRIAVEPAAVWARGVTVWERLRGRAIVDPGAEVLERLKSRKARVGEAMEKEKATRRFEPSEAVPAGPIASAVPGAQQPQRPKPATPAKAPAKEEADDFAARLLKAKKRALEEREKEKKDKDKPPS